MGKIQKRNKRRGNFLAFAQPRLFKIKQEAASDQGYNINFFSSTIDLVH